MDEGQIGRYLARIGAARPGEPDLEGLRALQYAHLRAVPFENLSIHLDEPVTLAEEHLYEKIVQRRRGGFCYELNGLFAALLRSLGYEVTLLAGRVRGSDGALGIPYDHLTLRVDLEEPWLADVGFGEFTDAPLRLDDRAPQHDTAGVYRITDRDGLLEVHDTEGSSLVIDPRPAALADFRAACWWHRTSPESPFTRGLTCSLRTAGGRVTLSGAKLITTEHGVRTETLLPDEAAVLAAYRTRFGIALDRAPALRSG
ncbi:arylamine N-acetyltransferase family protein [Actinocorallia populi]|uniref:arylamine N-acetyltransferase family protein n=1 Tax=Actinocorallia populi TaxID=2079200 RepID=UPI001E5AF465|nr:arylamine N-acetyltransferase [Actinocorallia populi]